MVTYRENAFDNSRDAPHDYPHDHHACDDECVESYVPGDASARDASGDERDRPWHDA